MRASRSQSRGRTNPAARSVTARRSSPSRRTIPRASSRSSGAAPAGPRVSGRPSSSSPATGVDRNPTNHSLELGMAVVAEDRRIASASDSSGPRRDLPASGRDSPLTMPGARIFLPRGALDLPGTHRVRLPRTGQRVRGHGPGARRRSGRRSSASRTLGTPAPRPVRCQGPGGMTAPGDVRRPPRSDPGPGLGGKPHDRSAAAAGRPPDAAIGYSMGESAALVALGAWNDRDEMTRRLVASPLFATELAGPCHAARRAWGLEPGEPVDWVAGIVPRSAAAVRAAIARSAPRLRADHEFGRGDRDRRAAFRRATVVSELSCAFLELPIVSTVHCEIGRVVEAEYHALHDLPTTAPAGIAFYSGVWVRPYTPDRATRGRGDHGPGDAADRLSRP